MTDSSRSSSASIGPATVMGCSVSRAILGHSMARDIAIDLGSANTLVSVRGRGIVLNEPTIVAMDSRTGEVLGMGSEVWRMTADEPERIVAMRPLRHGAITDFDVTERLIKLVFTRAGAKRFVHPRVMISVSSTISTVERRALKDAATSAGARAVHLIEEPMAAALGAGLPIERPAGNCVIDVGGGTTEVAVVSMGGIIASRAVRIGGFDLDEAIVRFMAATYGVVIGERTAERIKIQAGSVWAEDEALIIEAVGRDISTGAPLTVRLGAEELRGALEVSVAPIVEAVRGALADTPPELAHDVLERGMTLAGGGALLRGLAQRIAVETAVQVHVADSPLETVVTGAARALASLERLREHGVLRG